MNVFTWNFFPAGGATPFIALDPATRCPKSLIPQIYYIVPIHTSRVSLSLPPYNTVTVLCFICLIFSSSSPSFWREEDWIDGRRSSSGGGGVTVNERR